jgi:hypothetical protein
VKKYFHQCDCGEKEYEYPVGGLGSLSKKAYKANFTQERDKENLYWFGMDYYRKLQKNVEFAISDKRSSPE